MHPDVVLYNQKKEIKEIKKEIKKMFEEIFEEIFWEVAEELGINVWYDLFDSSEFGIVEERIRERFGVEDEFEVEGYDEWYCTMCDDL